MISKVVISKLCDKIQGGCDGTLLYCLNVVALGCIVRTQEAEAGRLKSPRPAWDTELDTYICG